MKDPFDWYLHSITHGVTEEHALKVLSDAVAKAEAQAKKKAQIRRKIKETVLILSLAAVISAAVIIVLCALPLLVECIASHI